MWKVLTFLLFLLLLFPSEKIQISDASPFFGGTVMTEGCPQIHICTPLLLY